MSETGFQFFSRAFSTGAELLYAACLTLFLRPFLTERRRGSALLFAGYLAVWLFCDRSGAPQGSFGVLLTLLLTAAAGALGLERAAAFLLAALYWNARISSGLMAESLYFIAERLLPFSAEPLEAVYLRAAVLVVSFLLSHAAPTAVMLYALQRQLKKQPFSLQWRELCCLSLIPTAGVLFGQMVSRLLIEFKDGVLLQLYERHPAFLAVVPMLALLFYAGAFLTIVFQQGMTALREEQAAYLVERQQTQAIRARIREAEQFYDRLRQLRHEMRGHLTNIKGLAHSGAYDALSDYIAQADACIGDVALALQTGNPVTDVIVNEKRQQCLALGIRFKIGFHYPESGAYDAFDIGIILQNLLQNALEACENVPESERSITLTGTRRGRFFLIEVRNAFTGKVRFGPGGLPVTSKTGDAPLHGVGLPNVRRAAEKYMGELELKAGKREFSATVLLQERNGL